jgi:hypothetical protein
MSCSPPIDAPVFTGRDNVITLVLHADGAPLSDLSAVTRVTVDFDGGTTVIDSDVVGGSVVWWTDQVMDRGALTDVLRLKLGGEGITEREYVGVRVVLFDGASYPNGLQVENRLKLEVGA